MASPKSFNDSIPDFFKIDDKILTLLLVVFIGLTGCLSVSEDTMYSIWSAYGTTTFFLPMKSFP